VQAQLSQDVQRRVFRGAFLRGADGIGSLVLTPKVLSPGMDLQSIVELSLNERPGISQLARAASAAAQFEQGDDLTDDLKDMLGGSWTIGGARPKAILRRDDGKGLHGESLIAKFQSKNDTIERNRLEYASLRMATEMGMPAAGHHLQELDGGGTALILERFDRCVVSNEIQRLHYVSAMSLASHQPQSKMLNSRMDQVMLSWSKLLELSSRVAERPAQARVQMFARLCLNTALQNTDDHLKNFGFLKRPGADHYELAPVFDVSPQGAQRHYLYCHDQGQVYSLQDVIKCARALGIAKAAAAEVEEAIVQVLHRSSEFFDEAGMNEADQDKANAWISSGLGARYAQREAAGQSVTIERPA
jgi:serine/threonine-protein kinase HipA